MCWLESPEDRPDFRELRDRLEDILQSDRCQYQAIVFANETYVYEETGARKENSNSNTQKADGNSDDVVVMLVPNSSPPQPPKSAASASLPQPTSTPPPVPPPITTASTTEADNGEYMAPLSTETDPYAVMSQDPVTAITINDEVAVVAPPTPENQPVPLYI